MYPSGYRLNRRRPVSTHDLLDLKREFVDDSIRILAVWVFDSIEFENDKCL
jgi:hypothetical protein